jgi:hypothetical protein
LQTECIRSFRSDIRICVVEEGTQPTGATRALLRSNLPNRQGCRCSQGSRIRHQQPIDQSRVQVSRIRHRQQVAVQRNLAGGQGGLLRWRCASCDREKDGANEKA